ncbi:glycerol-3-phosphate dehydrogenase [Falsochrobactrum sp. TDYN1]|uniref:Glycerol-3-phosphate dehydrogenase n=1 Tax=Falsochrobactrum tianjinense TaxID=2706015 RepID=A0A949UTQ7_9HYPH|nr:glycerol-3-phosphate dehydrogenase [Falsochrobactrum sp. TDYN1]MBV2142348.1 glycerol-3-phosphate dehydrogenase [Falsochrobactrum sp. TDYN1]
MAQEKTLDIFIIGGGINGCGIARDAAGRGFSVGLAEMNDLASGTSSRATKLIHGGLRYLEYYEFRLVREALMEREVLWANAPHIIHPMRFVLPYHKGGVRPAWLLRLGLFLYDHLGGHRKLPTTRTLDMRTDPAAASLKPLFTKAFEYSDCWVDDARFVALTAHDAANRGAAIHTRTKAVSARRDADAWTLVLENTDTGVQKEVRARLLVNAAGPWVDKVLQNIEGERQLHNVRLVQGSHIVVRKKFPGSRSYFFQNNDGRIIFAIPYEDNFTLIGTTDQDYHGDPAKVAITGEEIIYLCDAASEYFREPVRTEDVVWAYSGVRPLYDDGASKAQEATRDYVLKEDAPEGAAPLIHVFGGKLTTARKLAEHMLEKIERRLGRKAAPWTYAAPLPGGDFPETAFEQELEKLKAAYPFLSPAHARRLFRLYGTRAGILLGSAASHADLGEYFGADLYAAEVRYLIENEWARKAEDVLWRRTKLGLRLNASEVSVLETFMLPETVSHR